VLKIPFFAWCGQALSKIACSRLQKELAEWQVGPPAGFKYRVSDNLQRCAAVSRPNPSPRIDSRLGFC
jgi:hypothetical protein